MPEIYSIGWNCRDAASMKLNIDSVMKKIGLQDEAVTIRPRHYESGEIVETCNGEITEAPFIKLQSSSVIDVMRILSAFQDDPRFHVDVSYPNAMTPSGLYYFPAKDVASGQWRSKFGIKNIIALKDVDELTGALINARDTDSNTIFEYFGYSFCQIFTTGNSSKVHPGDSYEEYFKELRVLVENFINEGESFVFYPWGSSDRSNFRFRIKEYKE